MSSETPRDGADLESSGSSDPPCKLFFMGPRKYLFFKYVYGIDCILPEHWRAMDFYTLVEKSSAQEVHDHLAAHKETVKALATSLGIALYHAREETARILLQHLNDALEHDPLDVLPSLADLTELRQRAADAGMVDIARLLDVSRDLFQEQIRRLIRESRAADHC